MLVIQVSAVLVGLLWVVVQGLWEQSSVVMSMVVVIEEVVVGVSMIVENVGMVEVFLTRFGEISVESACIVEDMVGEIQQIVTIVYWSVQIIEELGCDIECISKIVEVICEIVD